MTDANFFKRGKQKVQWQKHRFAQAPPGTRDKELALQVFNKNLSCTYYRLGLLYDEEFQKREEALRCFEEAIKFDPSNAPALNSLGLHHKRTDPGKALVCFENSIKAKKEYGRAHKNLGLLQLYQLRNKDAAKCCFEKCLEVDPYNASAHLMLGLMMEEAKKWDLAEKHYADSIGSDPRNPMGYFRLGVLYLNLKFFDKARQYFGFAVREAPTDIRMLVKLADTISKAPFNEYAAARKIYRTALQYNHNNTWIEGSIKKVEQHLSAEDLTDDTLFSVIPDPHHKPLLESSDRALSCPYGHPLQRAYIRPPSYGPLATWACDECLKSIGGDNLKYNGAYHCSICKYNRCAVCNDSHCTYQQLPETPQKIGHGGFGVVYKTFDAVRQEYIAVKEITIRSQHALQQYHKEVETMKRFNKCPYIVTIFRSLIGSPSTSNTGGFTANIYMELMDGSLDDRVLKDGPVYEPVARKWIHQAASGLAILHKHHIIHRDIKPGNLLLRDGNVKLSDFGLSKALEENAMLSVLAKGTPTYTPPEVLESTTPVYTYAGDIWSLGRTWVAIVTGFTTQRCNSLDDSCSSSIPEHLTQGARDLLTRMLQRHHTKRPTAADILRDNYFSEEQGEVIDDMCESPEVYEARAKAVLAMRHSDGACVFSKSIVFDIIASPTSAGANRFPSSEPLVSPRTTNVKHTDATYVLNEAAADIGCQPSTRLQDRSQPDEHHRTAATWMADWLAASESLVDIQREHLNKLRAEFERMTHT